MGDWLNHAFSTYVLHSQRGLGYQWWSGPGGDLAYFTTAAAGLFTLYHHLNCDEPGCRRLGHRHPGNGRPLCRHHFNEL